MAGAKRCTGGPTGHRGLGARIISTARRHPVDAVALKTVDCFRSAALSEGSKPAERLVEND